MHKSFVPVLVLFTGLNAHVLSNRSSRDPFEASGNGDRVAESILNGVIQASGLGSTFELSDFATAGVNLDQEGNPAYGSSYAGAGGSGDATGQTASGYIDTAADTWSDGDSSNQLNSPTTTPLHPTPTPASGAGNKPAPRDSEIDAGGCSSANASSAVSGAANSTNDNNDGDHDGGGNGTSSNRNLQSNAYVNVYGNTANGPPGGSGNVYASGTGWVSASGSSASGSINTFDEIIFGQGQAHTDDDV